MPALRVQIPEVGLEGYIDVVRRLRSSMGFTEEEREEIDACFEKFDEDMSGEISSDELMRVFKYMGLTVAEEVFEQVVEAVDADGSGEIDQDEFVHAMKIFNDMQRKELEKIFEEYETDGNVSTESLYEVAMDLGLFPTEAAVAEAVQVVDKDGSGVSLDYLWVRTDFCPNCLTQI